MGEETVKREKDTKGAMNLVVKIACAIILLVTGWMFNTILSLQSETTDLKSNTPSKEEIIHLKSAVEDLKKANAQWATMAEMKEDMVQLKIQAGINQGLMRILLRVYEEDVADMLDFEDFPEDIPLDEEPDKPTRIRIPKFSNPEIDPDRFRKEQQQRYEKGK